eukprot:c36813_g1_i1 orf=83-274(+)
MGIFPVEFKEEKNYLNLINLWIYETSLITTTLFTKYSKVKENLEKVFEMTTLSLLHYFLGVKF